MLGQGYIFTAVCDSVNRGVPPPGGCLLLGGSASSWGGASSRGSASSRGGCWRPPRDGYCCGRYASYWNAFLFYLSLYQFRYRVVWTHHCDVDSRKIKCCKKLLRIHKGPFTLTLETSGACLAISFWSIAYRFLNTSNELLQRWVANPDWSGVSASSQRWHWRSV